MSTMTTNVPKILCVNIRHYPTEDVSSPPPQVTVVLVAGDIGDYAAYAGIGSDEFVAQLGNKISFDEACCHFPGGQLKRELYRD